MTDTWTHGEALIIQHCAVAGRLERRVRAFEVRDPTSYAQYPVSVSVVFIEPRKRRRSAYTIVPDNLRYLTIEQAGQVIYDSRADVPCEMATWAATAHRFQRMPAGE